MTANVSQGRATKIFCQRRSAGSNLKVFAENEQVRWQKDSTLHDQIVCTLGKPTLHLRFITPSAAAVHLRPHPVVGQQQGLKFGRLWILDPDVATRLDLSGGK